MNIFQRANIPLLFLLFGAAVVVLFPPLVTYPQGTENLDGSWVWANRYAFDHHFQWGVDYIFTYGPLGFMNVPSSYGPYGLWVISAITTLLSVVLTLWVLVRGNLRSSGDSWIPQLIGELIVCVLITQLIGKEPQTAFFLCGYALLCFSLIGRNSVSRAIFIAFLFALSASMKGTAFIGISALILVNLVAAYVSGNRGATGGAIRVIIAFPIFTLLIWVACGQSLLNFFAYLHGSFEMASGYNKTMAIEGYPYQVVCALLFIAFYLAAAMLGGRKSRIQISLFLITVPVLFLYWKEGFIRHDPSLWGGGHSIQFYLVLPFIFWVNYLAVKKMTFVARDLFLAGALSCLAFLYVTAPISAAVIPTWNPGATVSLAQRALETAFVDYPAAAQEKISTNLRNSYNLPPVLTVALQPLPTMVLPWDLVLAPAYHLPLTIPPVPQLYSVYTPYLDEKETDWLIKNQPPQILYSFLTVDNRYPLFDGPSFSYHVLRQYTVMANADTYAVLRRNQVDDLGIKWQGSPQTIRFDQEIPLPSIGAKQHLLMKVGLRRSLLGEIYGFFYKTVRPNIVFHLNDGTTHPFSLVYTTGQDGLLVSHFVDNLDQYVRLNRGAWPANVRSISFSIDKDEAWQFAGSFPVELGTADVTEGVVRPLPPPLAVDESWTVQSTGDGEVLTESKRAQKIPMVKTSTSGGQLDALSKGANKNEIHFHGWAGASGTGEACSSVVIVSGSQVMKVYPVDVPRPDVAQAYHQPDMTLCGFEFSWAIPPTVDQSVPLRVFGFVKGKTPEQARLTELEYNTVGTDSTVTLDNGLCLVMIPKGMNVSQGPSSH